MTKIFKRYRTAVSLFEALIVKIYSHERIDLVNNTTLDHRNAF